MNFWNSFKATYVHGWIFVLRWNVTSELRLLTGYLIEDWNPFYIWRKNCVGQRARVALETKKDDWVCKTIDVAFDKSKSVEVEVEVAYLLVCETIDAQRRWKNSARKNLFVAWKEKFCWTKKMPWRHTIVIVTGSGQIDLQPERNAFV